MASKVHEHRGVDVWLVEDEQGRWGEWHHLTLFRQAGDSEPALVFVCKGWPNAMRFLSDWLHRHGLLSSKNATQKGLVRPLSHQTKQHRWVCGETDGVFCVLDGYGNSEKLQELWQIVFPHGRLLTKNFVDQRDQAVAALSDAYGASVSRWSQKRREQDLAPVPDAEPTKVRPAVHEVRDAMGEWMSKLGLCIHPELRVGRNLILEGVPGTGKTFALSQLRATTGEDYGQGRFAMTMHPATSYEDFVEGLRPGLKTAVQWNRSGAKEAFARDSSRDGVTNTACWFWDNSDCRDEETSKESKEREKPEEGPAAPQFTVHDGFFVRVCREAVHSPDRKFVVLLDEINRCNIPKVMGDLLTTLEPSKRARWVAADDGASGYWDTSMAQVVTLPYSQRSFFVPDNIIVVGTMNTTDRSVAPMDAALRRRFAFARVYPLGFDRSVGDGPPGCPQDLKRVERSWNLWAAFNYVLQKEFGDDAMLGHSYFYALLADLGTSLTDAADDTKGKAIAHSHWNLYIFPQLIDVLVSNDLVEEVMKENKGGTAALTDKFGLASTAAEAFGELKVELRGRGLLRTPSMRFVPATTQPGSMAKDGDSNLEGETRADIALVGDTTAPPQATADDTRETAEGMRPAQENPAGQDARPAAGEDE